jgi:hypothetical protein
MLAILSYQLEEESSFVCLESNLRVAGLVGSMDVVLTIEHGGRRQLLDELRQPRELAKQIGKVGVPLATSKVLQQQHCSTESA